MIGGERGPFGPGGDKDRQIEKLTRINDALIRRVERSFGEQSGAFALFQTAVALDHEVRARTAELNSALERLAQANYELTLARDAAERANRSKTGFFTAVGHDLLQPLQAARLTLSILTESEQDDRNRRLVLQVDQALSTVEDLLRTILDLSRLDAGSLRPSMQPVSLGDMFDTVASALQPHAAAKGLTLVFRPTAMAVESDPMMLRRILINLVANAIRYTDRGGILVGARRRGPRVRIEIWDSGHGIPESEYDRIFQEFERGAASRKTGALGLGLGLSIVRRMADALGHTIDLRSRLGRGSCFAVMAQAAAAGPAYRAPAVAVPLGTSPLPARVGVIENDEAVASALIALLQRWNCEVVRLRSDTEVGGLEEAARPGIVLADYHLDHGACGLEIVAALRARWGANLPAIVVTADHSPDVAAAVASAGCELMRKPVKPAEMRALMAHLLG